jgi:iron complex transport system substrate-binding protein
MRIISLLPSATEIICALGLEDQLVGVTHECDFPASIRRLPKVTQTLIPVEASSGEIDRLVRERLQTDRALYTLDLPMLEKLQPDLIVTQALCDVCAVAEDEVRQAACMLPGAPQVINLEPQSLTDVIDCLRQVAAATGVEPFAEQVIAGLKTRVETVTKRTAGLNKRCTDGSTFAHRVEVFPRVAFLEWLDPPFSSGHWTPELVRLAGGVEGLGVEGQPSRTLRWDEVLAWQPQIVLIACCGFSVERTMQDVPLLELVPGWQDTPAAASGQVYVTDGSHYFSRPGPRLVDSLEMLAHLFHPEAHPHPNGVPRPLRVGNAATNMPKPLVSTSA